MHCSLYAEAWLPDSHLCMHVNYYILNTQKKKTQSFRYLEVVYLEVCSRTRQENRENSAVIQNWVIQSSGGLDLIKAKASIHPNPFWLLQSA